MNRFLTRAVALAGAVLLLSPERSVAEGLDEATRALAKQVKELLDQSGERAVSVGQFRGNGAFTTLSASGPAIAHRLTEALKALQVQVQLRSSVQLFGDFEEVEGGNILPPRQMVRLKLTVQLKGGSKRELVQEVDQEGDVMQLLSLPSFAASNAATPRERRKELKERLSNPQSFLDGNRILTGPGARLAIEISTGPSGANHYTPRRPEVREGLAFVPIEKDEVYAVTLHNGEATDAAVALQIDGLSTFVFCDKRDPQTGRILRDPDTNQPLHGHVIVPAGESRTVRGWFINLSEATEFKVTEYAKSAAAGLNSSGNLGTITACFHSVGPAEALTSMGTGQGQRFEQQSRVVNRRVGDIRGAVSVRYVK